jgi:hypothetical protein
MTTYRSLSALLLLLTLLHPNAAVVRRNRKSLNP